jgi:hypothetical protein
MDSFKKRQKEMQRMERQRDKAAKRLQRKLHRANGGDSTEEAPVDVPQAQPEEPQTMEPKAHQ